MDILDQAKQDMPFTPAFLKLGSAAEMAQRENSQKAQSTPESLAAQRAKAAAAAVLQKRGMNMQGNEVSPAKEVINVCLEYYIWLETDIILHFSATYRA